jgi:hypothetical protein
MMASDQKTALVIGHPGHELRVFGWLEKMRPAVFVITDGSGRSGQSRLSTTTRILDLAGASRGAFYGPISDAAAYEAILNRDFDLFINLMRLLGQWLIQERGGRIIGDALEGYSPTHDVCRLLIGAAVEMAQRATGITLDNLAFSLTESSGNSDTPDEKVVKLELDEDAFTRKMAVARSYSELEAEVNAAVALSPPTAFRTECLHRVANRPPDFPQDFKPYYEQFGEQRVESGYYQQVIRYREHVLPLAEALWRAIEFKQESLK